MINKKFFVLLMVSWLLFVPTDIISKTEVGQQNKNVQINALGTSEAWRYTYAEYLVSSPAFIDINHDGNLEIVFCDYDKKVICVDNQGTEKWRFETDGYIEAAPAVADVDADGRVDVIVGDEDGQVYCIDENGSKLWNYTVGGTILYPPLVADVEEDGELEILVACQEPRLYYLDGFGEQKWNYTGSYYGAAPVVGDVDNDDSNEIILPWGLGFVQLNSDGSLDFVNSNFDSNTQVESVLTDLGNDNFLDLLLIESADKGLYCLNASDLNDWQWYHSNLFEDSSFIASPVVADINYDGKKEVIVAGWEDGTLNDGIIYCFNATGQQLWNFTAGQIFQTSPAIADLDGDQHMEIIIGTQGTGCLYGIDHNGIMLWNRTGLTSVESTPLVIDIDKDGMVEILLALSSGTLICYDITGATISGKAPWYRHRGTIFNTAYEDTDSDYIDDFNEPFYSCDYDDEDKDNDGLTDGEEIISYMTDPTDTDTDNDNVPDGVEIDTYSSDPLDTDSDDDGLDDGEEVTAGLDGHVTDPTNADSDNDGLNDYDEYSWNADPNNPDSDSDGVTDGDEITYGTSPVDPDTDSDGFTDGEEIAAGTDPLNPEDYPVSSTTTEESPFYRNLVIAIVTFSTSIIVIVILRKYKRKRIQ